jgi:hypothetical protein
LPPNCANAPVRYDRGMARLAVLIFASIAGASAADWKSAQFPEWSDDVVLKMLTDSPWSRPGTVRLTWRERTPRPITYKDIPGADHQRGQNNGLGPLGGIGAPTSSLKDKADIIVRWASALPVRHATALYKHRESKSQGTINSLIPDADPDYVVELFGLPAELAHQGTGVLEALLKEKAFLRFRSGKAYRPVKVDATIHGLVLSIKLRFARSTPITRADGEVEVLVDGQVFSINEKFRIGSMMYQGHLEL